MSDARSIIKNARAKLPTIEKGIPMPLPAKTGDDRHISRSPWPKFLEKLEQGDSFTVSYPTSTHVMAIAKWMGLVLVRAETNERDERGLVKVRLWRA